MEAQQQQPPYHYQYTTLNDPSSAAVSLSYDSSSQLQSYDQSSYYAYPHHQYTQPQQQQQEDYSSSHYYPDYSKSHQYQPQSDPNSIHPPGVPIPADNTQQSYLQNTQNLYYSHGVSAAQPPPSLRYTLPGNLAYRGGGSHAGQSMRGGGRGTFGRHGRGRGAGGRGKHASSQTPGSSSGPVAPPPGNPPPQKAWCELCKVECNTHEILEQHKNGKKHQKNLKVHQELQNLSGQKTTQNPQMQVSHSKNPEIVPSKKPEGSTSEPPPAEAKALKKDETAKAEPSSGAPPSEKSVRRDRFVSRGGGFKRGMRGGRGGKWMKAYDGSRRQPVFEPPKPKQLGFPVVCELCNVKCESQVVYDSHIAGKKHLANAKRFPGHKEALGVREVGLQALYPTTIPNPSTQALHQSGLQDAQALASMMLSQQNLQDPQAAQAALAQLLSQHGIHDAQTLLVQLIPYLLAQFQVPGGLAAAPLAGFGMVNAQNPQSQAMAFPAGVETHNVSSESKPDQHIVMNNDETEGGVKKNGESGEGDCLNKKPVEGPPENNDGGTEQVPSGGPAKEEPTVSEN